MTSTDFVHSTDNNNNNNNRTLGVDVPGLMAHTQSNQTKINIHADNIAMEYNKMTL